MHQARFALLAVLCAGTVGVAHAVQDNVPAAQSGHASTYPDTGQPQWEIAQPTGAKSSGAGVNATDCPSALGGEASERIDPPGPVGESGTASAMVEDSGTLGSTGSTRATSTSGATGTTGEVGNYGADPSGSVTTAGSTGAPIDPLAQCDAGPATSTGDSGAATVQHSQSAQGQGQGQGQGSAPAARQPAQPQPQLR